ncbi:uncharacterized protein N7483_003979 [Penicillium malachiteum]|uniref:uncharacterized protein n=1 Tax=Penicillium malachiteum TaxID=1324776 RepID=UPI002546C3CB|nr:uncharacterized protein N7483_003979 [Penicillium malachiteum]KAJ5729471.1 hypothetical protein N7483_003979 [Penicillium malachiteum]
MSESVSVRSALKQHNGVIRLMEAHDPVSSDIVRNFQIQGNGFQGLWVSGLTQTTHLGIPDTEIITPLLRATLLAATLKSGSPGDRKLCAAFDADSGGDIPSIPALVRILNSMGVSMIVIEDKDLHAPGEKVNSLLPADGSQAQANPHEFARKIHTFIRETYGTEIMITARIESFNTRIVMDDPEEDAASVRNALADALSRAEIYTDAGADAVMIHSKSKDPDEVLEFIRAFRAKNPHIPVVVVPTTYSTTPRQTLIDAGANVIIYANHLMRAKIKGVHKVAKAQLEINPALFADNEEARASLDAQNYGSLLRVLKKMDFENGKNAEAMTFYVAAKQRAISSMARATLELLLGDKSGCEADSLMITVKDLLKINSYEVGQL